MYNPSSSQGADSYYEYIELYNYGQHPLDLKNWLISDDGSDVENLTGFSNSSTLLQPGGYAVITDEDSLLDVPSTALHLSTGDNTLCTNGISNIGETITLSDSSVRDVDSLSYLPTWGGNGNGKSIEKKIPDEENEQYNWGESLVFGGTPGIENSVTDDRQTSSSPTTTTTKRSTTTTTIVRRCSDGTKFDACSRSKPKYCSDGVLVSNCSLCGCSSGYICVNDACVKKPKNESKTSTKKQTTTKPESVTSKKNPPEKEDDKHLLQGDGLDDGSSAWFDGEESEGAVKQDTHNLSAKAGQGNGLTSAAIFSTAKNPKTAATIALSVIGGGYILHKKRKNASVKAKLEELDRMAESEPPL